MKGNLRLISSFRSSNVNIIKEIRHKNETILIFASKKDAIKALSDAKKYLKSDKEDWLNSNASYKYAYCINYDSSKAVILKYVN